ncbi:MAG: gliding motility-associated C-terminal domain-containing protein, partial [Bacteroidia bacterium]|nr:gliding motility-associated C-terminal domain-containing protein [Bacteroidia bacterium]
GSTIDSVNCYLGSDGSVVTTTGGGSGGYTYQWDDASSQTTATASNLKKGTYKLIVKDIYGCSDSASYAVQEPTKVSIVEAKIKDAICYGYSNGEVRTSTQGGTPPYTHLWNSNPPQYSFNATDLLAGDYKYIVRDVYGCSDSVEVTINEPEEVIPKIIEPLLTMKGMNVKLNVDVDPLGPDYYYQWEPLDVFKDFATNSNPVITLNETTDIKVTVSNQAGCFGQDSINMQVIQPLSKILPNAITPNGDGLNDVFKANDYFELLDLKIYNRWGQMVYKSLGSQKGWDGTFAGEKVPAGVYVYVIQVKLKYTNQTISHTGNITIIQ